MATTDANGIVFLEETDPIAPFQTTINTLQQGTSDAIGGLGSWRNYTPVLSTPTGSPTLGSGGSLVGRYTRIGNTVIGRVILTLGTGFSPGSGSIRISLPANSVASQFIGDARIRVSNTYTRAQVISQGPHAILRYYDAAVNGNTPDVSLSASNPGVFAAGDQIHAEFTYEVA